LLGLELGLNELGSGRNNASFRSKFFFIARN